MHLSRIAYSFALIAVAISATREAHAGPASCPAFDHPRAPLAFREDLPRETTHRRMGWLIAGTSVALASGGILAGGVHLSAVGSCRADGPCKNYRDVGIPLLMAGGVVLATGIAMMVVGARKVPNAPRLAAGLESGLSWSF